MTVSQYIQQIVSGKRVAFVGLAPCISGKGLGGEIDAFDVVIRTNIYPIPEQHRADYGKKCDIIVLHHLYTDCKYNVKNILHYRKIKDKSPDTNYCLITLTDRMRVVDEVIKVMGKNPIFGTQGTNLMHFCLEAGAKEFRFFGITGYQNKEGEVAESHEQMHYVHKDWEKPNGVRVRRTGLMPSMKNHKSHDFQVLNDYTRYMLKTGAITMDKYSLEYFV